MLQAGAAAAGTATTQLPIPANVALMGASLFAQGLSFDQGVNAAGLTASNGLRGVLGS